MSPPSRLPTPLASWFDRWSDILPLLLAEFVVWLGFGALLPVMPLYFREHGVDLATLGVVIAAWPAARLVGEPIFGWLADRVPRVPLMVAGNVGAGIFQFLPLIFVGPVAVPPPPRPPGSLDRGLRPGGPRLHHRRDAARAAGRGVRAVRGGADGRARLRSRRSVDSGRRGSGASASSSSSARSARSSRPSRSGCVCGSRPT